MSAEDEQVAVHREPVWRADADFVFHVSTPDVGGTEQLWAKQLDSQRVQICCIPFFVYGIALGDVVLREPLAVLERSGRSVFRVWFGDATVPQEGTLLQLRTMGALVERSSTNLVGVSSIRGAQTRALMSTLDALEVEGKLLYDVGYLGDS